MVKLLARGFALWLVCFLAVEGLVALGCHYLLHRPYTAVVYVQRGLTPVDLAHVAYEHQKDALFVFIRQRSQ